ncbi:MAG TPA: bifunctional tetrahydrofolate synthase/dihydrofolate synthase [Gammaproteobacteria bacterium]|nr:bifunctional tetrahydrofolate synthase/dihydrofolate synthase [Gammaproteobacteria bacterium]
MPFNSLPDWLSYIETLHPKTIALGLDRVQKVANTLGVRVFNCPIIIVGGTNGKGSCVTFLESILQAAGYRTGTYTSPHLLRFEERGRINNQSINEQQWVTALAEVEKAREEIALTYFEMTTLAVLWLFQRAGLDALILEVGLGGRLDAVNIVDADVAVITTIALDHMDWLGDNREAIGSEKAGIFRRGKPAVCGDFSPPVSIRDYAQKIKAPLYCINQDFNYQQFETSWNWQCADVQYVGLPLPSLPLQNAASALMALQCLPGWVANQDAIALGLKSASLPGRFQQFTHPVNGILDVAHNPAAAAFLAARLQTLPIVGKTLAVVSILADKDIAGTLQPLLPYVDSWYVSGLAVARGVSSDTMLMQLRDLGVKNCYKADSVAVAFQNVVAACGKTDRVLVFGSFHTVAEVLEAMEYSSVQIVGSSTNGQIFPRSPLKICKKAEHTRSM